MKDQDSYNNKCIMEEDLGCYECYKTKPNLIKYCNKSPCISDIEAYELEMRARYNK